MGLLSDIKAMKDVQRIKSGGKAKLSIAQITNMIVNMPDAQKNLSNNQFKAVYALYQDLRTCNTKMEMDINGYYATCIDIIKRFDVLAPYEKYGGGNELEMSFLMEDIRKNSPTPAPKKTKQSELFELIEKHSNNYDIDAYIKAILDNDNSSSISYVGAKAFTGIIITANLYGWKKSLETFRQLLDEWLENTSRQNYQQALNDISHLSYIMVGICPNKDEANDLQAEYTLKVMEKVSELKKNP